MRKIYLLFILMLLPAYGLFSSPRERINLDFGWYFHLGDVPSGETADYSQWRQLDIPHDWSIEGEYSKDAPGGDRVAFLPTGTGWYKKEIDWRPEWAGKVLFIEFDGVFMNSTVYVNGEKAGYRPNGYLTFGYDITSMMRPGRNVISVKVDNSLQPAARWYTGSGIYRPVNLVVMEKVHVPQWGTHVLTHDVSAASAGVSVEALVRNLTDCGAEARVTSVIRDMKGNEIDRVTKDAVLDEGDNTVCSELSIGSPVLWSPDSPVVYYLDTEIEVDGKLMDVYRTRFGVRTLAWSADKGFLLNGTATKLKGVCIHQDASPAGAAVTSDILYRRLKLLKDMGCNAIRTTHHPFSTEFYEMCDTMGFMVMDEPWDGWFKWKGSNKVPYDYGYYFLDWWEKDLQDFIRRDRNWPCVVMWSCGNEVWGWDRHQYLQYKIVDWYHKMDPTRPVTQAWALGEYIDIAGFNANGEGIGDLEKFHKANPDAVAVGTEIPHTRQTRGVYRTKTSYNGFDTPPSGDPKDGTSANDMKIIFPLPDLTEEEVFPEFDPKYASSYDNHTRKISCREEWKQVRDNDFYIGDFRWTGIDYLGESWGWPARTNNYGVIDLAGFPKDSYYLYQSFWLDTPMVHILPHWTHPGKEGVSIPVVAYTNAQEAELFFNGGSLGKQAMDPDKLQIVWYVPYRPGTLEVRAYNDGKTVAEEKVSTAGRPSAVRLSADRTSVKADKRGVIHVTADIVDSKGRLVPYADNDVVFKVEGPGTAIGTENGDILDLTPNRSLERKAFMGKLLMMVKAGDKAGDITITAYSDGLKKGSVTVECIK